MKHENNPHHHHKGHFTAYIGNYQTFNVFLSFYQDAVEKLYREVSEGNETADSVAIPMLFMMRHAMELGYKYTINEIFLLNGKTYDPKSSGHSFQRLHKLLKTEFDTLWKNGGVRYNVKASFDEYYEVTKTAMIWFDDKDPNAENFRYPRPELSHDKEVNLLEAKNKFDDAMPLLTFTVDVVTQGMQSTSIY